MNTAKKLVVVSIALALGISSAVNAATQKEEDSVHQWGRWAVLSPAAGGSEPYVAAIAPGAVNNVRPEDADEFEPVLQRVGIVPINPELPVEITPPPPPPPPVVLPPNGDVF